METYFGGNMPGVNELARLEEGKIVLVNGPPRSGKDTIGTLLERYYPGKVTVTKMAKLLKERTHALYGLTDHDGAPLPHDSFEGIKDVVSYQFFGLTPRQAYIRVSEAYMKPTHGSDIWGRLLLEEIKDDSADLIVITDSGFAEEAMPIVNHFGRENTVLLRVHRDGTTFEGDSRDYVFLNNVSDYVVKNNDGFLELASKLAVIFNFDLTYSVQVGFPVPGSEELGWFTQGRPRATESAALASVEALRRGDYGKFEMRIILAENNGTSSTNPVVVVREIHPSDAPVADLV